jgi:hypothetical protein
MRNISNPIQKLDSLGSQKLLKSEILLVIRAFPSHFISSSAAIVSTPSHRFCKRRFSLAAC